VKSLTPARARGLDVRGRDGAPFDEREAMHPVGPRHSRDVDVGERCATVARGKRHEQCQRSTPTWQTADRGEDALILRKRTAQERAPRKVDRDLVSERLERDALERLAKEQQVRQRIT